MRPAEYEPHHSHTYGESGRPKDHLRHLFLVCRLGYWHFPAATQDLSLGL
jgi:hypothetical protein